MGKDDAVTTWLAILFSIGIVVEAIEGHWMRSGAAAGCALILWFGR